MTVIRTEPRRAGDDRRRRPTPWFSRYTLRGRRTQIRRTEDLDQGRYVDRAEGPYFHQIVLLVALVALDAVSTLIILGQGGGEANPVMRPVLERGTGWFLLVKLGPLPVAFLLLSITYHFGWIRWGMRVLLAVYACLACWHFLLLVRIFA